MFRKTAFAFAAALLAVASATSLANTAVHQEKPRCGDFCTFHFCKADGRRTVFENVGPRLNLRDPNVATHPFVCRKIVTEPGNFLNQTIKVRKTAEAEVHPAEDRDQSPRPFVKISQYSPAGLSPRFSKKYFGLQEISAFPPIPGEKGISRKGSRGNQEDFVDDLCVILPVKSYDLFKENGSLDRRVRTKQRNDCVSFRSSAPTILIELTWDNSDDLDVSVKEPNGNVLSFRKPNSASGGRLILDQNVGRCGEDPDGREQVRWGREGSPDRGTYEVTVRHFSNCNSTPPTNWFLAVIIDGKLQTTASGRSNRDNNKKIKKITFDY